jgi:hypothetical protein
VSQDVPQEDTHNCHHSGAVVYVRVQYHIWIPPG